MKWLFSNRRVAGAAYLFLITLMVAHMTNAFIADALYAPVEYRAPSLPTLDASAQTSEVPQSVDAILRSGLFLIPATLVNTTSSSGHAAEPPPPPLDAAKKLALLGTVFGAEGGVMAVLEEVSSKRQVLYRLGTPVPNVGTLMSIEKTRVLFREGKTEEWLDLALVQTAGAKVSAAVKSLPMAPVARSQPMVLDRREVAEAVSDTTRLLTQAQAVPYLTDGKLDGFRLYSVVPQGFFDKMGLQTNDIMQRINGVEIRDPGMLLSLFQQLKSERTVRVDLVRNSQRQTLAYEIR